MIVITEFMDEAAVESLRDKFDVVYQPDLADRPDALNDLVSNARGLIVRNRTQVTKDLLARANSLECVGRLGVGLDNINMDACADRGVEVYPALGANNLAVAEYVVTTAMVLLRGAYRAKHQMLNGRWPRQALSGREIAGTTLGLIGFGSIARDTAKMAKGLGCHIIGYDPFLPDEDPAWQGATPLPLGDVLRQADIISLHVPLTDDTHHLIDAKAIAAMKEDAILINAARGGTVDEDALAEAMHNGHLAGAALDVFENEPLSRADAAKFKGIDELILTPHIAGVTEESNTRVSALIAQKVGEHLSRS